MLRLSGLVTDDERSEPDLPNSTEEDRHIDKVDNHTTYRDGDDSRQGVTGHHVRHVLMWGLIGVLVAFIVVAIIS
jgi:hypothetical protein